MPRSGRTSALTKRGAWVRETPGVSVRGFARFDGDEGFADVHLDNYQGLGPGLPMSVLGLPADDPLALVPLADMGRTDVASQMQMPGQMFGPLPGPTESGAQGVATPVPAPAG